VANTALIEDARSFARVYDAQDRPELAAFLNRCADRLEEADKAIAILITGKSA
jgi:hypothetical protein